MLRLQTAELLYAQKQEIGWTEDRSEKILQLVPENDVS